MSAVKSWGTTTALTGACALVGSTASSEVNSRWYRHLRKPDWQPPDTAFPVVWTTLYTDIASTTALACQRADPTLRRRILGSLAVNLSINAAWSWVFFRSRRLDLAPVVAGALTLSSADLVRQVGRADRSLGVLLAPYPAWTGFATALSEWIRRANG